MPFKSWQSYFNFEDAIQNSTRYIFNEETEQFLEEVKCTSQSRRLSYNKGDLFWRAQLGSDAPNVFDVEGNVIYSEEAPYPPERMKPLKNLAREGRANPKGIAYLYLATSKNTAMSEVRPWIGGKISLAKFKLNRALTVINCSENHSVHPLYFKDVGFYEPGDKKKENSVWTYINKAFSMPVLPNEDRAHYAPTQVIAELFKKAGFDGVAYKSMLSDGLNVALFDPNVADLLDCVLYEAKSVTFDFIESGPRYSVRNNSES